MPAGHAAIWLMEHDLAEADAVGGFVTPAIMVDILSQMVDHPDVLCEQFLAGHDPEAMLEFFWRHRARRRPPSSTYWDSICPTGSWQSRHERRRCGTEAGWRIRGLRDGLPGCGCTGARRAAAARAAREALANLRTVLELCLAGELKCSATTGVRPSATTIRTVGTNLADGDFYPDDAIAAFAWPLLLQSGGLAKLDGTRLRLTPKSLAALRKPPAEVVRGLWQRWLTHGLTDVPLSE